MSRQPLFALLAGIVACGGTTELVDGGTASPDGSGGDATLDSSLDALADVTVDVGDGGPPKSDARPPPTVQLKCADESQCDGGGVCCATLTFLPQCELSKITSECKAPSSCPTILQPFCKGAETVRLCESNATCTEPGADHCCTFDFNGKQSLVMCSSLSAAASAGASCL